MSSVNYHALIREVPDFPKPGILFYDITTLPYAMGLPFTLQPSRGPVPDNPIRSLADVQKLDVNPDPSRYQHIIDLLKTVKKNHISDRGS